MESNNSSPAMKAGHQANEIVKKERQGHLTVPVFTARIPEKAQAPIAYQVVQAPILLNPLYGNFFSGQLTNTLKVAAPVLAVAYNDSYTVAHTTHDHDVVKKKKKRVKKEKCEYAVHETNTIKEDDVVFVNAKQYKRIMIRRKERQKLTLSGKIPMSSIREKYLHESRHLHAANRERGSGGRFLSKPVP